MKLLIMNAATCVHLLTAHVPYHWLISHLSCQAHLNPRMVAAIIQTESRFNPRAVGFDSGGYSWGLMQVKLSTARWLGFTGSQRELMNPVVNLKLGIRYLAMQAHRHPYGWDAISGYNLGTPSWNGHYANREYVHRVWINYRRMK